MPLLLVAVVGLLIQFVNGGLGLGYGTLSMTFLLGAGMAPAAASAAVHLAKIGVGLTSGLSHWRFGNVDWPLTLRLGIPGAIGAFIGAVALTRLPVAAASPYTGGVLLVLGVVLLIRFARQPDTGPKLTPRSSRFVVPIGFTAGAIDASGGGGWGPVTMSTILASGRWAPNKAVGSVSAAEFAVGVAAVAGFLWQMPTDGDLWPVAGALLVGGVVAAPLAAWLVRRLPIRPLGTSVGALVIATNALTILRSADAGIGVYVAAFSAITAAWIVALTASLRTRPEAVPA